MTGSLHQKDVFVCVSPGSDDIPSEVEEFGGVCVRVFYSISAFYLVQRKDVFTFGIPVSSER